MTLIVSTHLNNLHGEEGVVHSEDGRFDVSCSWKPVDHDEDIFSSLLTQHCKRFHLFLWYVLYVNAAERERQ